MAARGPQAACTPMWCGGCWRGRRCFSGCACRRKRHQRPHGKARSRKGARMQAVTFDDAAQALALAEGFAALCQTEPKAGERTGPPPAWFAAWADRQRQSSAGGPSVDARAACEWAQLGEPERVVLLALAGLRQPGQALSERARRALDEFSPAERQALAQAVRQLRRRLGRLMALGRG